MIIIYKKILLAVDGSFHSNNAVKKAIKIQKICNCRVIIIHSIRDNRVPSDLYPNVKVLYSKYSNLEDKSNCKGGKMKEDIDTDQGRSRTIIELCSVEKHFQQPSGLFTALAGIDLIIKKGSYLAIVGKSGTEIIHHR